VNTDTGLNPYGPERHRQQLARHALLGTLGVLGVLLATGCAIQRDFINLSYGPAMEVARVSGADVVNVQVTVVDLRANKDKVSCKKNGYGMEMAEIVAKNDVAELVRKSLETELTNRGFVAGPQAVSVLVELAKFYSDFKIGLFAGDAIAEISMNVQVKKTDGTSVFSKVITGDGKAARIQLATGGNAKIALDAALKDALTKLFADAAFVEALLKAGKT
jgi:uncharacterized lipoprotein